MSQISLIKDDDLELTDYSDPCEGSSGACSREKDSIELAEYSSSYQGDTVDETAVCDVDNDTEYININSEYPVSVSSPESDGMFNSPTEFLDDFQDVVEQSCCWKFLSSIWRTRLTVDAENSEDRDSYVKTTLRELIFYIGFVLILCLMTYSMTSATMYYFTKNTKDLFIDDKFIDSHRSMAGFYSYTTKHLLPGLYWETYYNNIAVPKRYQGYIFFENKILGRPRLRQLRVRNNTCTIAPIFKKHIKKCYGGYTHDNEEKSPYGARKWNYNTSLELGGRIIRGGLNSYHGGGYTVLLGDDQESSRNILENLQKDFWLDRGTRAVFIEFTIYNGNINLFCIVTLIFEFPETGGMNVFHNFNTLKMLRYVTPWDYVVLACEIIFIIYLIYYSVEELMEVTIQRWAYFKEGWNVFDVIIIIMGYITVIFTFYTHFTAKSILKDLVQKNTEFANFGTLGYYQRTYNELVAVFILLAWIKIFKYLNFNKTMMHLHSTLSRCAKDVAGFAVMFLIIFIGFSAWGNMIFGTQLKTFNSFPNSMNTLFRLILGDFNFYEMRDVNPVIGPIYFVLYVFLIFFVLINMFLAIINDTYAEVKEDIETQEPEFNVGEYLSRNYKKMREKMSSRKQKIQDIQEALATADTDDDKRIDYEEWRTKLKEMGHVDAEIECVFARYDKDGDRMLNEIEVKLMQDDLDGNKVVLDEEIDELSQEIEESEKNEEDNDDNNGTTRKQKVRKRKKVPLEKFTVLNLRVDRLEHSTGNILSKVDLVMSKMAKVDKGLLQRRSTIARVFDGLSLRGDQGSNVVHGMEEVVGEEMSKWDDWGAEFMRREKVGGIDLHGQPPSVAVC